MSPLRLLLGASVVILACGADDTKEPAPAPAPAASTIGGMFGFGGSPAPATEDAPESPLKKTEDEASAVAVVADKDVYPKGQQRSGMANAVDMFKEDLWQLITIEDYQDVIAAFALLFGLAALLDGRKFFQVLVLVSVVATIACFVLCQLRTEWSGKIARIMKYVAALEGGLFVGYAAKKGWEGTQLCLGLVVGCYMFHNIQALSKMVPYANLAVHHSAWIIIVGTLSVAVGCWMLHEKGGGGRVLGLFAPLFGSSLVVATMGYLVMLGCTIPSFPIAHMLHVTVTRPDVPSIFEFWAMTANPMHSQAVGVFHFAGQHLVLGAHSFEIDRLLSVFFCLVIFFFGARYQIRADKRERQVAKGAV